MRRSAGVGAGCRERSDQTTSGSAPKDPEGLPNTNPRPPETARRFEGGTGGGEGSPDPGWGHFELYGLGRAFRSHANFSNRTIFGGGGVGAIFPIVPKLLDLQAGFLIGDGIGRYGTVGLPDVVVKPTRVLVPIPELQALVGLVGHPTDYIDLLRMPA